MGDSAMSGDVSEDDGGGVDDDDGQDSLRTLETSGVRRVGDVTARAWRDVETAHHNAGTARRVERAPLKHRFPKRRPP